MSKKTDALKLAQAATDRLFEAHDWIDDLDRDSVYVGVAQWEGRNGVCKFNRRLNTRRFGKRMSSIPRERGSHAIVINERILYQGNRDEFIDTVQHELAHAICFARHSDYPSQKDGHGVAWKEIARKIGADPSSCHRKRDRSDEFDYYIRCPECGMQTGRTKRSKIIQKPFMRKCTKCGHAPLSSFEQGQEPPKAGGVVAVESIPWNNKTEYWGSDGTLNGD
jgi:predicted SprT family Zn-dependent metalloprotease